jgi:tRNA(Ile)-lysidine synthase
MQILNNSCIHNSLTFKVAKTIVSEKLIQPEDAVIVALSGGPDSIVLLHVLHELKPHMFQKLGAAHLNHCIRPNEAQRDAKFVKELCLSLNIPFFSKQIDVQSYAQKNKLNIEEAGRVCRYNFFKSLIQNEGYTKVATGHHSDDNAELILMYLIRGSGPLGVSGIPIIRNNTYVRPLLKVTQNEIMKYCAANNLQYVSDSTNNDLKYTRNRIRHRLIPYLRQDFNPNIVKALNTLATITQSENEWISQITESIYTQIIVERKPGTLILSNDNLSKMHPALIRRILRSALMELKGELKRIGLRHIEAIMELISKKKGYLRLNLPDGIMVERINAQLQLCFDKFQSNKTKKFLPKNSSISFNYDASRPNGNPVSVYISELNCEIKLSIVGEHITSLLREAGQNIAFFDMDRLTFPLRIRNPKPGDRFSPLGLNGTQKLKDYFINAKIPQTMRKRIPIVESGKNIIWIAGCRCSNFSRIRFETKHILKAEFFLLNAKQ